VFLQSIALSLLTNDEAFTLLDPHSDLGMGLVAYLHSTGFFANDQAYSRLIYCKWARTDYALPFNILNQPRYDPYVLAQHVHEAIMRAFPTDSSTPLLSSILLPTLVVLIERRVPISMLIRFLTDRGWRDELLESVHDPLIVSFFHDRFDQWGKGMTIESVARRLQLLTFSPVLRYSLGQHANVLDFRQLMDRGISVIMDFGGLDTDTARLLACLVTVFYEKAALSREDTEPQFRKPHHLLIDEAPTVVSSSGMAFSHLLEQARKYNLFLCLAHQTMAQFDSSLTSALTNIQMEILFRESESDARFAAHRFAGLTPAYYDKRQENSKLASPTDIQAKTALTLERLPVGHALVRNRDVVTPIQTLRVPAPAAPRDELLGILDEYARRYGVPTERLRRPAEPAAPANPLARQEATNVSWFDEAAG